jgi:ADP-ribose pyrophosphatase YjhB (NUDIX family)
MSTLGSLNNSLWLIITRMAIQKWLEWAQRLQGIAQTGIAFSGNPFDIDRYKAVQEIAAEMTAEGSGAPVDDLLGFYHIQSGYATPKLDVRGAIFKENSVLLVQELLDHGRWTLPGGFVDVNDRPGASVEREVREESGYEVRAAKLAMVYDRNSHPHPPYIFHVYKLFFVCELLGGTPVNSHETAGARYFPVDDLPELSLARVTPQQIKRVYDHFCDPALPTDFD